MITFGAGNLRIPRFEKPVYVVAGGLTDFRKRYPEKNTSELCADALNMAVHENDLKVSMKEFKGLANFCVYSQFADHFGDYGQPNLRTAEICLTAPGSLLPGPRNRQELK